MNEPYKKIIDISDKIKPQIFTADDFILNDDPSEEDCIKAQKQNKIIIVSFKGMSLQQAQERAHTLPRSTRILFCGRMNDMSDFEFLAYILDKLNLPTTPFAPEAGFYRGELK